MRHFRAKNPKCLWTTLVQNQEDNARANHYTKIRGNLSPSKLIQDLREWPKSSFPPYHSPDGRIYCSFEYTLYMSQGLGAMKFTYSVRGERWGGLIPSTSTSHRIG